MAISIGELIAKISADSKDFRAGLDLIDEEVAKLDRRMKVVGRNLTKSVTLPILALGTASVLAATKMDSLRRGMVAVTGTAKGAEREISRLAISAKLPGLGFKEAIQGSVRLQAAGASADEARRSMEAFGNALALVGGGKADLNLVTLALGQILSAGRVLGQEVRQLQQRVPQIRQAMIDAFGVSRSEDLQRLGVSSEEFIQKINTALLKLPQVTSGIKNAFDNLIDDVFKLSVVIGETLLPVVTPMVQRMAEMAEKASEASLPTKQWGVSLAAAAAAIGPMLLGLSFMIPLITAVSAAFTLGMGPAFLAIAGLGVVITGVVAALGKWKLSALETAAAQERLNEEARDTARTPRDLSGMSKSQLRDEQERLLTVKRITEAGIAQGVALERNQDTLSRITRELAQIDSILRDIPSPLPPEVLNPTIANVEAMVDKLRNLEAAADRLRLDIPLATSREQGDKLNDTLVATESQIKRLNDALNSTAGIMARIAILAGRAIPAATLPFVGISEEARAKSELMRSRQVARQGGRLRSGIRPQDVALSPRAQAFFRAGGAGRGLEGQASFFQDLGSGLKDTFKRLLDPQLIISNLATGGLQSLLSGVGGGFLGTLFGGGGESPQAKAAREASERLAKAMGNLGDRIKEMADSLGGQAFGGIGRALANASRLREAEVQRLRDEGRGVVRPTTGTTFTEFLNKELLKLGLTFADLERLAETLGIELPLTAQGFRALGEAISAVDFAAVLDTFAGKLSLLRREFDLLDIDDPLEQIARISEILQGALSGDLLARVMGIDFGGDPTAALAQLLDDLRSGAIDPADLGGLSLQEFLELIGNLETLGDAANDASEGLNAFSGALRNVPTGFKVALGRFGATTPSPGFQTPFHPGPAQDPASPVGVDPGGEPKTQISIEHVTVIADDPEEFMLEINEVARRESNRGGPTVLDVSVDPRFI